MSRGRPTKVSKKRELISIGVVFLIISSIGVSKKVITKDTEININTTSVLAYEVPKYRITVDIGHGGHDNGTSNSYSVAKEKDVNLEIGLKVVERLSKIEGLEVLTTRTTDEFIPLKDRVDLSNNSNSDLFVSIHCNASGDGSTSPDGIETFYYSDTDDSSVLADIVHNKLLEFLLVKDRGIKKGNYQVLRDAKAPAILVECGFLTNPIEGNNLTDERYQYVIVDAIVSGIKDYLNRE